MDQTEMAPEDWVTVEYTTNPEDSDLESSDTEKTHADKTGPAIADPLKAWTCWSCGESSGAVEQYDVCECRGKRTVFHRNCLHGVLKSAKQYRLSSVKNQPLFCSQCKARYNQTVHYNLGVSNAVRILVSILLAIVGAIGMVFVVGYTISLAQTPGFFWNILTVYYLWVALLSLWCISYCEGRREMELVSPAVSMVVIGTVFVNMIVSWAEVSGKDCNPEALITSCVIRPLWDFATWLAIMISSILIVDSLENHLRSEIFKFKFMLDRCSYIVIKCRTQRTSFYI